MLADGTCFVCGDGCDPLYRVCKCDTLVHGPCFTQLVTRVRAHERACPVCTFEYRVRTRVALRRCNFDRAVFFVLCCAGVLTLQVCTIVVVAWAVHDGGWKGHMAIAFWMAGDTIACVGCCAFQGMLWVRTARRVVLPPPTTHVLEDAAMSV